MPAIQRGHARKRQSGKWQLRYYDADGTRKTGGTFTSKSAAMQHYRDVIEPRLNGTEPVPELTLSELVELYLERHAAVVRPRTITTLRERLVHATRAYGDVSLRELERMAGELARLAGDPPGTVALRDRAGTPAGTRRGRPLGLHEPQPRQAGRAQPGAAATLDPRLHAH